MGMEVSGVLCYSNNDTRTPDTPLIEGAWTPQAASNCQLRFFLFPRPLNTDMVCI